MFDWLFRIITLLVFNSLGGGHTDKHIQTNTDIRIKVISRNQTHAWFKKCKNTYLIKAQHFKHGKWLLYEEMNNI